MSENEARFIYLNFFLYVPKVKWKVFIIYKIIKKLINKLSQK